MPIREIKRFDDFYAWIRSYVPDEDEAIGLTNQIYYLSTKHSKTSFVIGLVLGSVATLTLLKWLS